jgi:hypothetical protein
MEGGNGPGNPGIERSRKPRDDGPGNPGITVPETPGPEEEQEVIKRTSTDDTTPVRNGSTDRAREPRRQQQTNWTRQPGRLQQHLALAQQLAAEEARQSGHGGWTTPHPFNGDDHGLYCNDCGLEEGHTRHTPRRTA